MMYDREASYSSTLLLLYVYLEEISFGPAVTGQNSKRTH